MKQKKVRWRTKKEKNETGILESGGRNWKSGADRRNLGGISPDPDGQVIKK